MALKVGVEDRKKVAIAASLAVVVLILAVRTIFGGPDTPPPSVPVATTAARQAPLDRTSASPAMAPVRGSSSLAARPASGATQLDPTLHPELMAENEAFVYNGSGRNIFSQNAAQEASDAAIERVKAPIRPATVEVALPSGPPPPPAIDLRFFGYSARRDGSRKAFLLHGDDVFIAAEGDIVSHRYKVVRIAPSTITVEDLPFHNTQSLPLVLN